MYKLRYAAIFLLIVSATALAQQDPHLGTWRANIAKSKADPGPMAKSSTTKFEAAGANGVKAIVDLVNAEGKQFHYEYTANDDGKDVPVVGSSDFDMVSYKRTDPNTRVSVWKKGGTVVRMLRSVVSKDGKSRTLEAIGIDGQGRAYHDVTVYDKQ